MSKKIYQECEGCNNKFPIDSMSLNNDCDWTCAECVEEGKLDKRVRNLLFLGCAFVASFIAALIYNSCSK